MKIINFKGLEIEHISKSNLKNCYISVTIDKKIVLKTPKSVTQDFIYSMLTQKESWIKKKLSSIEDKKILNLNEELDITKAKEYLTQRVDYFSKKMDLKFSELRFKNLKSRWGSCSSSRVVTLNLQLFKIDKDLIDYVIVHELSHLVYMNHSKDFHNLVERYLPNSKLLRQRLKKFNLVKI